MAIARNHPIFNWIRCKGMLFHDTLNKVRSGAEEYGTKISEVKYGFVYFIKNLKSNVYLKLNILGSHKILFNK